MAPLPSFVPALGGAAAAAGLSGDAGITLVEVRNVSGGAAFLNVNGPQLMACPVAADIEGTTSNVQVVLRDVNEQPGLGKVDVLLTAGDCADGGRILRVGPDGPLELGASIEVSSSTSLLFAIGKASTQPVVVEGRTQAASTQFTVTRLDARGVTAVRSRSFTVSAMVATTALTVDDSDQPIVLLQAAVVGPLSLMDSLTGVSTGTFTSPSGLVLVQLNNQLELVRVGVIDFPEPLTSRSVSATDGLLLVDFRCLVGGTSSDGGLACRLDESSFAAKLVRRDGGSL